jgi:hypothetical protein
VFVSVDGGDDASGAGTQMAPVKTLAKGLAIAVATSKTTVVLDQGTYAEAITLGPQHGGITIAGGWEKTGTVWERDCSATARQKTLLQSPTMVGLAVTDSTSKIALRTMSVQASEAAPAGDNEPGPSCYGIHAAGAAVALSLDNVVVLACKGGAGGLGNKDLPAPEPDCTQLTGNHCKSGTEGAAGEDGPSAPAGTYTAQGYSPAGGTEGKEGSQGQNGTPGTDGDSKTCVNAGCSGGAGVCGALFCGNANGSATVTTTAGKCGCGGRGGPAGAGGPGGGGSFGIFATGAGTVVSITSSAIESSDGGKGSAGQSGEAGNHGGDPVEGTGASCGGDCSSVNKGNNQCNCEQPGTYWLAGGSAGGPGGKGGLGGPGGGGSGGPSIAVVRHGGALVLADGKSELKFGTGGQPGDANAAFGAAAAELSAP